MERTELDLLVKNAKLVQPYLGETEGHLGVAGGRIVAHLTGETVPPALRTIDVEGRHVLPGLVDPHFHIGYWNPFIDECRTETMGAAVAGITSMVLMLKMINLPPEYRQALSYLEIYPDLKSIIESNSTIDVAIRPYPNTPRQIEEIPLYANELGMTSFKFVTHFPRGSREAEISGTWGLTDGEMIAAFEKIKEIGGVAVVHAENQQITDYLKQKIQASGRNDLAAWCESRPDYSELEPIQRVSLLANRVGIPVYFVHVTAAASIDFIEQVKGRGWKVFAEAVPHYLSFTADSGLGILGRGNPPLRDEKSQKRLWEALANGTVSCVGSDHMAIKKAMRTEGDVWTCRWGSPRCETMLPVLFSEGVRAGKISLTRLVELCSCNPARIFGLYPRKGTLQVGADADLVVVDLESKRKVDPSVFPSYSDYSLWEGQELAGWPVMTIRRGEIIAENGALKLSGGGKLLHQKRPAINSL